MSLAWISSFYALGPFLALGLLGAVHCAGMCGGFAIWVSGGSKTQRPSLRDPLFYLLGKATTYAMLGVLVSSMASSLQGGSEELPQGAADLSTWSTVCAWLAGGVLMLHGASCLLGGRAFRHPKLEAFWTRIGGFVRSRLAPALSAVRALPGYAGPLGVGLLTGLIPCGLSWSAILLAAALPPAQSAIGMFAFGLATSPALLGVAFGWRFLSVRHRRTAAYAAGPLLLLFGALTVIRGGVVFENTVAAQVLPECCGDSTVPAAE